MPQRVEKPPFRVITGQAPERLPADQQAARLRYIQTTVRQGLFLVRDQGHLSSTVAEHLQELFPHLNYAGLFVGAETIVETGLVYLSTLANQLIELANSGGPAMPAGSTVCFEAADPGHLRFIAPQHLSRWSEDPQHGLRSTAAPPGVKTSGSVVVAPLRSAYDENIRGILVLVHGGEMPALEPLVASQYATELAIGIRALQLRGRIKI